MNAAIFFNDGRKPVVLPDDSVISEFTRSGNSIVGNTRTEENIVLVGVLRTSDDVSWVNQSSQGFGDGNCILFENPSGGSAQTELELLPDWMQQYVVRQEWGTEIVYKDFTWELVIEVHSTNKGQHNT